MRKQPKFWVPNRKAEGKLEEQQKKTYLDRNSYFGEKSRSLSKSEWLNPETSRRSYFSTGLPFPEFLRPGKTTEKKNKTKKNVNKARLLLRSRNYL